MRIFISYASENRTAAEEIVLALKERGHKVFFDRDRLAPGDGFHRRIEREVRSADLVVFLISPHAVADGGYTLTELRHVMGQFEHPLGRVLPVMVAATPLDCIPAYLRAVTILEPQGSVAAEVGAAVDRLRPGIGRKLGLTLAALVLAVLIGAGWLGYENWWPHRPLVAASDQPVALLPALFGEPPTFSVSVRFTNPRRQPVEIGSPTLLTDMPGRIELKDAGELSAPVQLQGGATLRATFEIGRDGEADNWLLCWLEDGQSRCSEQPWQPPIGRTFDRAFDLPPELDRLGSAVVATEGGFLLAASRPARLARLSMDGQVAFERPFAGEITTLTAARGKAYVGTRGPAAVASIDTTTGAVLASWPVTLPPGLDGPVSDEPASLAADADGLWLITRGTSGEPGLLYADDADGAWKVPPYYHEVSFELRDMSLRMVGGRAWGAEDSSTPASLYRFGREGLETFSGHDFEAASCTRDVADLAGRLVVWTCDGRLHALDVAEARLRFAADLGAGPTVPKGADWWDRQVMAPPARACSSP